MYHMRAGCGFNLLCLSMIWYFIHFVQFNLLLVQQATGKCSNDRKNVKNEKMCASLTIFILHLKALDSRNNNLFSTAKKETRSDFIAVDAIFVLY